jgi:hypothetical protein
MLKGVFGSKKGQATETDENYVINSFSDNAIWFSIV